MKLLLTYLVTLLTFTMYAQPHNWKWAKNNTGDGHDYGYSICADNTGRTYVTGTFQSPSSIFGSVTVNASPNASYAYYIAAFDSAGEALWVKTAGSAGTSTAEGMSVACDNAGNVYVTGTYHCAGTMYFGTTPLVPTSNIGDCFLAKYNTQGVLQWAINCGAVNWNLQYHFSVSVNDLSQVFVAGAFEDTTYLACYNNSGVQQWRKKFGTSTLSNTNPWSVTTDASGNPVVAGYTTAQAISFGPANATNTGNGFNVFVVKNDVNGNELWAYGYGSSGSVYKPFIKCDLNDNVFFTGYYYNNVQIGNTTLVNSGLEDIILVKLDPQGSLLWAKKAGGANFEEGSSVTTDNSGNVYIAGFYRGLCSFGSLSLSNGGNPDLAIAKYNTSGQVQWVKSALGSSVDRCYGIALDAYDRIVVTGSFTSPTLEFDTLQITNSNPNFYPYDFFIACMEQPVVVSGIEEATVNHEIYPQPLQVPGVLYIKGMNGDLNYRLYNLSGQIIYSGQSGTSGIFIPDSKPGLYILEIHNNSLISRMKIVVEK